MEPILKDTGKLKCIEILHFEDAELSKEKGNDTSFATFGSLSVLYIRDYSRFMLQLNDWKYPLLRRLPISSSAVKDDPSSRVYVLPAPNGFSFNLKISKVNNKAAFDNLETVLDQNSKFSIMGKDIPYRKLEPSPDDKLFVQLRKESGAKEIITETVKQLLQKVENKVSTMKTGTKNITSTKKKSDLKEIKRKNFRKEAKSRIKKDFFESTEKLSQDFLQKRRNNPNHTESKSYDELRNISDNDVPVLYIFRTEIEEALIINKSMFPSEKEQEKTTPEKRSLMQNLREKIHNVKEGLTNLVERGRERDRMVPTPELSKKGPEVESLAHYQG